jgi:MFS superfamily sulfate permease-like transporter
VVRADTTPKANEVRAAPATVDADRRSPFRPARQEPLLTRAIPVAAELPRYRGPSARRDAVAGVTVAALAIPSAMAYAEVAGLSPVNGLYALLVAICFAAAWALRLGWIADDFSRPVLIGYIHGVAVVLVISQLGKLLGLSIDAKEPLPQLWEAVAELGGVSGATVAVSALSLAALVGLRQLMPKLPAALLVVVAAIDAVEVAIAAVTTVCVIFFGVLEALVVVVGLSMVDTVRRSARPHDAVLGWVQRLGRYADVSLHPSARTTPAVVVYRLDDRLFFANARYFKARVREAIRAAPGPVRWLVLDADAITHADATGLEALLDVTDDLRRDEITLVVARLRTRMEEQLEDAGVLDALGRSHLYPTVRGAVDACAGTGGDA